MRTFLATAALLVAALPAMASECATVEFDWAKGSNSPKLVDVGASDVLDVELVGTFLWYGLGDELGNGLSSVEVPLGAVSATACAEGVTFALPETTPTIEPTITNVDVSAEEWLQFIEPLVFGIH